LLPVLGLFSISRYRTIPIASLSSRLGMPDPMERTALLADNDHTDNYDETEGDISKPTPAHAHFKLPIKILTIFVSVLSIAIFVLLIASFFLLTVGPIQYTYPSQKGVRDLAICVRNRLFHYFVISASPDVHDH
jgi:hypothetical protein